MIVVDTSALMAILLDEPKAQAVKAALESNDNLLISASTFAEALIVADRRGLGDEMARLIDGLGFEIVPTTASAARRVAQAHFKWGRGSHRASLNFGDCFSYELAKSRDLPLLFVGRDFSKTDLRSVM